MGQAGGVSMSGSLDEEFFDFSFKILNYAVEFAKSPGYSSLRFTDVLEKMVELSFQIEGIDRREFYEKLKEKFKSRRLMSSQQDLEAFLDELLQMYVDEWRNK